MNESDMMHGKHWCGERIAGWHVSEKYDGIRAFWDGAQLWTRYGNAIRLPGWFAADLPPGVAMDGELWAGYDSFAVAQDAAQRGQFSRAVRFMVHDMPAIAGDWLQRMQAVWRYTSNVVMPAEIFPSRTHAEIKAAFCKVRRRGGEGLVARNPLSQVYLPGRSRLVLKIKDSRVF